MQGFRDYTCKIIILGINPTDYIIVSLYLWKYSCYKEYFLLREGADEALLKQKKNLIQTTIN